MPRSSSRWLVAAFGLACVVNVGCSANRMAVQSSPQAGLPNPSQSVSTPGTSDVAVGEELRHPANVFVAYARWQEQQRQLPQARESFEKALKHDPKSVEALLGLSRLDRLAGRNAEAERRLTQAEKLRQGDPLISAAWGEHYAATGRYTEAINRYRFAVEQAPDEALYKHQLAVVLVRSGAVQDGLDMFAKVVHPAEAHYNVGYLLQGQSKLLEAEAQYQRALALNPQLVAASNMLAKVRKERGVPGAEQLVQAGQKPATNPVAAATHPNASPSVPTNSVPVNSVIPAGGQNLDAHSAETAVWQAPSMQAAGQPANSTSSTPSDRTAAQEEQRRNQQF